MTVPRRRELYLFILSILLSLIFLASTFGEPSAPTITYIRNMTNNIGGSTLENGTNASGGRIVVMNLNHTQQNTHWKAYVGNVSGSLVLKDADSYSIYEWSVTTISGEVYATRSTSVTWSSVVCANDTHVQDEMDEMNHTTTYTPSDNISITFNQNQSHDDFLAGPASIAADSCNYTTDLYVNGTAQSGTEYFEEILLFDGSNIVYATIIEQNQWGYSQSLYDYQILVAEKGEPSWFGSNTPYYFYVELL